jgi:hypothetical protein
VHYDIGTNKQDASITTVIDPDTLNRTVSVRSFMTGIANSWDVQPGEMLKQVADIELPQMFDRYTFATANAEPSSTMPGVTLQLTIPDYAFSDFHAKITVHATAYAAGHPPLLDKSYSEQGESQGSKMFWAGAFGMKSAIRQSSLDAYKKIFVTLRGDLKRALDASAKVGVSDAAGSPH